MEICHDLCQHCVRCGLSPIRPQAIVLRNVGLLLFENISWKFYIDGLAFSSRINFCKMWTILSRPYCVYKLQLVASTISLFTSLMTTKLIYTVYWFYRGCPYAYMYIVSYFNNNFPVGFIFNHEHSPVSAIWTATSLFRVTQHEIQHKKKQSTCLYCQYNKALSCNVI